VQVPCAPTVTDFVHNVGADCVRPKGTLSKRKSLIALIAFTDLAFSLDSVTTAIALADRFWILLTGGILGMLALRFLTGLFVRWLAEFVYLQDAAYLTVLAVGGRLLLKPCQPTYLPPEWMVLMMVAISLSWGFSKRVVVE
jgi:predicted tellurium resistance membrane protein TerC